MDRPPFRSSLRLSVLAVLLLAGCTTDHVQYRKGDQSLLDVEMGGQRHRRVAVIELDDYGNFWDPGQLAAALDLISDARRQNSAGVVVVTYVHGWHHDASREDTGNLFQLKWLLGSWQAQEKRTVLGVYLAWRGESVRVPGLSYLTFFDRISAARRVASPPASQAILHLLRTTKGEMEAAQDGKSNLSVFIGHSMGAMILERSLQQALVGLAFGAGSEGAAPPGGATAQVSEERLGALLPDLVLLLNSAGQALDAEQLIEFLSSVNYQRTAKRKDGRGAGDRENVPLVIAITSQADSATRALFPLGMAIQRIGEKFRPYECESSLAPQKQLYSHTAGHTPSLFSHAVTEIGRDGLPPPREGELLQPCEEVLGPEDGSKVRGLCFSVAGKWFILERLGDARNNSPYWILQVPKALIPDHSKIFGETERSGESQRFGETFLRLVDVLADLGGIFEEQEGPDISVGPEVVRFPLFPLKLAALSAGGVVFSTGDQALWRFDPSSGTFKKLLCLPEREPGYELAAFAVDAGGGDEEVLLALRRHRKASSSLAEGKLRALFRQRRKEDFRLLEARRIYDWKIVPAVWNAPDALELARERAEFYPDLSQQPYALAAHRGRTFLTTGRGEDLVEIPLPRGSRWAQALNGRSEGVLLGPLVLTPSGDRLVAANEGTGALYTIEPGSGRREEVFVPKAIMRPVALAFLGERLLVADAEADVIWSIDCDARDRCAQPASFGPQGLFRDLLAIAVDVEGNVWASDRGRPELFRIRGDGRCGARFLLKAGAPTVREEPIEDRFFPPDGGAETAQNCWVRARNQEASLR